MTVDKLIKQLQKVPVKDKQKEVVICMPSECCLGESHVIDAIMFDLTNDHVDIFAKGDC